MIFPDALPGEPQTSSAVLMIRPAHFGSNVQTRGSNYFQHDAEGAEDDVATQARHEFDAFVTRLAMAGVHVAAFEGRRDAELADEVFPNNWLSLHADGTAVLYPLMAENRRRMQHLEGAIRRLEERTSELALKRNALRQEEITEEIEVILLSARAVQQNPPLR